MLDPIGPKMIYLGQTLTFTATATDADVPAQVLSFTLDRHAARRRQHHARWRVQLDTRPPWAPTRITIRVIDNGVPSVSDSETITVAVLSAPRFSSSLRNGPNLELTWGTVAGKKYAIDYKANLNAAQWTPLLTNQAVGTSLSFTNSTTNAPQGFFRIRTVP